jgi:membrane fusion protein, multidrug efflux system
MSTQQPESQAVAERPRKKRWIALAIVAAILIFVAFVFAPTIVASFSHESTDDATVNSHITLIAPRIDGVATEVLVDDNQFVQPGTLLIKLDPEPLKLIVDQKRAAVAHAKTAVDQDIAALDVAKADLAMARSQAAAQLAGARGSMALVATVQDIVRYETAALRSGAANIKLQEANLNLAQKELDNAKAAGPGAMSKEDVQRREAALEVNRQQLAVASESVEQTRALLELAPNPNDPAAVPADVAQNFAGTQYAVSSAQEALAHLGLPLPASLLSLGDVVTLKRQISTLDPSAIIDASPTVKSAEAKVRAAEATLGGGAYDPKNPYNRPSVHQAESDLAQAELQLSYTEIKSPIAGYVNRRAINPGGHVMTGQPLLAIRPLSDVWIDANFKETQLDSLRIGQSVDIHVDAYPHHIFKGRVAGFAPGTGAMLSLLPPENATGNFVKVVQRLPVRIELTEPNPSETPLLAGLSVEPEIDIKSNPTGPNAGQRLQSAPPTQTAAAPR